MSRFFRSNDTDSESESDFSNSSASDSSDNESPQKQTTTTAPAGGSRFSRFTEDSDDEDVKRVVKTPRQKQTEELLALSKSIIQSARDSKWQAVSGDFDKVKVVAKKLSGILKGESMPRVFIRALALIETSLEEGNKDKASLSKLSTTEARGFNQLKQRLRKYKDFSAQVAEERANPTASDDEVESKSNVTSQAASQAVSDNDSSDSEDERAAPAAAAKPRAPVAADSDSDADSESGSESDWGSESESESESEDESGPSVGFSRWLKKTPTKDEGANKKVKKERVQKAVQSSAAHDSDDDKEDDGFTAVGKGGKAAQGPEYSPETLNKFLLEVTSTRGRKSTDKTVSIEKLEKLLAVAGNPLQKCKVLMALISAQFDNVPSAGFMSPELWNKARANLDNLLSTLENNRQITISEDGDVHDTEEDVNYNNETITLRGSIISFIDRLDDEFTKSLQSIDPHTPEYVGRMRDTVPLYTSIVRAQQYFERCNIQESVCRIVLRRIEHLYYRTDQVNLHVEAAVAKLPAKDDSKIVPVSLAGDMEAIIHNLCAYLYLHAEPLLRTRAMLMHIFNHALHKRYYVARDLMLMSHLQENVHQADVNTQVLYNRALAQLGLAAFRLGKIQESLEHTTELESSTRQRELLAQGVGQQRTQQLSPKEEQLQRQRQLP
ncbi:Translation initiation factor 3 subunit c, partial [Kickxella alabastrina]